MHVRQQIRNEITKRIKTISALRSSTYESRVHELNPSRDLPAALVFTEGEMIEPATRQNKPGIQKRMVQTVVYVFARADELLENSLDAICEGVENVILEDDNLGGIAERTYLEDSSLLIGAEVDAPTGACRMSFITIILTQNGASAVPIQKSGGMFNG